MVVCNDYFLYLFSMSLATPYNIATHVAMVRMLIIAIASILLFFVPIRHLLHFAACASGSCYYAALERWQRAQDNRKVCGKFCLPSAAGRERKVAVNADGGSEVPLSLRSNDQQLDE